MLEQNRRLTACQRLRQWLLPDSWLDALLALLLAAETLFAICQGCGWLETLDTYQEFSVTVATWSAVNKTSELRILNLLLFGLPIGFCLYGGVLRLLGTCRARAPWLDGIPVWVLCLLRRAIFPWRTLVVLGLLCGAALLLLTQDRLPQAAIRQLLLSVLLLQFLATILLQLAYAWTGAAVLCVAVTPVRVCAAFAGVGFAAWQAMRPSACGIARCWRAVQLGMPLVFLYAFRFVYCSEETGATVTRYASWRWTALCLLLFAGSMSLAIWRARKRDNGLWLSTMASVAAVLVFCLPSASILTDWFHYGEYAVTTQQLLHFGSLPYVDFIPIHGLCDYVYSGAAAFFFDGTFAAMAPGVVCGNLIVVLVVAVSGWCVAKRKTPAFLLMLLLLDQTVFSAWGYNYAIRWIFGFLTLCLLNSTRIRQSAIASVLWWAWLSMLGILWNPSIGGVLALAFVPVLLRRLLCAAGRRELAMLRDRTARNKLVGRLVPLAVAGICYLPIFGAILRFIRENAGTTGETNGMQMLKETDFAFWFSDDSWLRKFLGVGFLFGFVVAALRLKDAFARAAAWEAAAFTAVCTPLLANYIFVRYDDGDRAVFYWTMLGACFALPILVRVWQQSHTEQCVRDACATCATRNENDGGLARRLCVLTATAVLGICLGLQNRLPTGVPNWQLQTATQPSESTHVDGAAIGMPNLGEGYLGEAPLRLARSYETLTRAVCTDEEDVVFNGTTRIALTVLLDEPLATRYTSLYNISNRTMQEAALEQLRAHPPKLVLLQNGTLIDEMSTSMRSFLLYQWLVQAGYRPYTFEGLLFLTNGTDLPEGAMLDWNAFCSAMQMPELGAVPRVWGQAEAMDTLQLVDAALQTTTERSVRRLRQTVTFDAPISGATCDYICLDVSHLGCTNGEGQLQFSYDTQGMTGVSTVRFSVTNGTMLVPVSTDPAWLLSTGLTGFTVTLTADDGDTLQSDAEVQCALFYAPKPWDETVPLP